MISEKKLSLVTTMTPHRLGLAGGGSDIPYFFNILGGSFINVTINKYVYVTVKKHSKIFKENFRIMYSKTEIKKSRLKIENEIVRTCLGIIKIKEPILITTNSDLPAGGGLGSSSEFTVGLLNALYTLKGIKISKKKLAETACFVEINLLKKNGGIQDQYAAAYGGINKFLISKSGLVKINSLKKNKLIKDLLDNIILYWTGNSRVSENISKSYDKKDLSNIEYVKNKVLELEKILNKKKIDLKVIGDFYNSIWNKKKNFSKKVSNKNISKIHEYFKRLGSKGGKLSGAGGGGFYMAILSKKLHKKLPKRIENLSIKVNYCDHGSKIITKIYE